MNAEVGTRVEDSWLCTAKNARLGLCLTLRALDLLVEKPFELKYLKNEGVSITHQILAQLHEVIGRHISA